MSISEYGENELGRLNEEAKRLENYYKNQSEAVKIDFRRRYDEAIAVLRPVRRVWARIDAVRAVLEKNRQSKWRKAPFGILVVGALVYWWLSPDEKFNFNTGAVLMVWSAIVYLGFKLEDWNLGKELTDLDRRQDDYLYQWEATGAGESEYWGHRDRIRDEAKLHELPESDRETAKKDLEVYGYILFHRLRKGLFRRASGTREDYALENGEYVLEQDSW